MAPTKVDPSDPAVRRLVYNMYRGMLGGYNDQANSIVDALPPERVREDQGVYKQLEDIIRQSSQQSADSSSSDAGGKGDAAPPFSAPPPPPPPPAPGGAIPTMRINSEIQSRGRSPRPTAPGEPPAAIQNAMMTKDKKPFTYTPGGLDLSQIRSPRIQRRINRNMADEGVGPLPAAQEHGVLPAAAQAAMQPNLPVQVLPAMPPPPPPPPQAGQARFTAASPGGPAPQPFVAHPGPLGGAQAAVSAQAVQQTAANLRPTSIAPLRREQQQQNEPVSVYSRPEPRAEARAQLGSLYIPPVDVVDAASPPAPPQRLYSPQSPLAPQANLNKAPTPWMSSLQQQPQQQYQPQHVQAPQQQYQPPQQQYQPPQQQYQPPQQQYQPPQQQYQPQRQATSPAAGQPGARIIPIQIEGREPPSPATPHTPLSPQEAHLSQWQREQQLRQQQRQQQQQQQQHQQVPWRTAHQQVHSPAAPAAPAAPAGERVIPIMMEATSNGTASPPAGQRQQQRWPAPQQQGGGQAGPAAWAEGPPVQSQSFRVLQKITDDAGGSAIPRNQQPGRMNEMNAAQLRKLQLNDEDRALMNKFKAQVDDEVYLHQESDPRYRGAAIPSRAFRMLQNMTGEDDGNAPLPSRISPAVRATQQAVQESVQRPYVPPSEQTVQEPRKYTGGAIPSRSFRMLQAMTAGSPAGAENCDPAADTSDL